MSTLGVAAVTTQLDEAAACSYSRHSRSRIRARLGVDPEQRHQGAKAFLNGVRVQDLDVRGHRRRSVSSKRSRSRQASRRS